MRFQIIHEVERRGSASFGVIYGSFRNPGDREISTLHLPVWAYLGRYRATWATNTMDGMVIPL